MSGGKKTTTTSNQQQTATSTVPDWMSAAGQQNYQNAQAYQQSGAMNWDASKAAQYANPYQQQVQQNTMRQMGEQNQLQHQNLNDQAQAARAYGGTRHGVIEAAQARDQGQQMQDYLATSNAQGYDAARQAFESDRAAQMGGYAQLQAILGASPHNTTTTGTSTGTQVQKQSGSFLDSLMGVAGLGLSAYSGGLFGGVRK